MLKEILPLHTLLAFTAMRELRTGLTGDDFVERVDTVQRRAGYRLVGAFPGDGVDAVAVAGSRVNTSLSWGRHVYIDDLSTVASARRQGFASQLLAWIHNEADRLDCSHVHLDSGVGAERQSAHRLYLNTGYVLPHGAVRRPTATSTSATHHQPRFV